MLSNSNELFLCESGSVKNKWKLKWSTTIVSNYIKIITSFCRIEPSGPPAVFWVIVNKHVVWDSQQRTVHAHRRTDSHLQNRYYEPRHDKTNKMSVRQEMTQISLDIRPVWSVFAVRSMGS